MKVKQFCFVGLVVCLFLSAQSVVLSQQAKPTRLYAKGYKDSIALRWHPFDIPLWEKNITVGYDVYRKSSNGQVVKLNDSTIKALDPYKFALRYSKGLAPIDTSKIIDWDKFVQPDSVRFSYTPDSLALKAMILQFPKELGYEFTLPAYKEGSVLDFGTDPNRMRWLFHSIHCLSSKEAAIVSGLYFLDKKVDPKEKYTYYLTTSGEGIEKALATITLSAFEAYPIHAPRVHMDFTNKRRSVTTWKKTDTTNVYIPVYDIFRSEKKNGTYVKMNAASILAVYTGSNQRDSTIVTYSDTTLEKKKAYFYKVRGMDVFGDYTPFSEPYAVTEKTLIEMAPYIEETVKIEKPLSCQVKWKVEESEADNIYSFIVYRSKFPDSLFKPLSPVLKKEQRDYIDKSPTKNNYYKVMTIGQGGDTLWTSPSYLLIPDSIPPLASIMKEAICDSNGVVKITWKHNGELDLHSFKLYRANYKHEEFSRVATINRIDTIYYDTIALGTLTEQVYYKLLTYDDSYNPSPFSNIIKAKRYDIIPPTFPVFTNLRSDSSGINLTWGNSSSEDVIKTILYRKLQGETTWHEYKVFARDTMAYTSYVDTSLYKGQWYEYTLQAFDDDKLVSGFSPAVQLKAYDNGIRPELKKVTNKVDRRKKIVKFKWVYPYQGVELFQIYRATDDGKLLILKSVEATMFEFYDRSLVSGKKYRYSIKAVFKDGGESPFSKDSIIQF